MIKTNLEKLVETAVCGEVCHPCLESGPGASWVAYNGEACVPPVFSGISFNVKVGDFAFDWAAGDHVAPGVAISHPDPGSNAALSLLACIGNDATIIQAGLEAKDPKAKGAAGTVTGKSGGRVLIWFPKRVIESLCVGDRIQIRASGVGASLADYPDVRVMNCGPRLLKTINLSEKSGRVRVPVAKVIPGKLMGSGLGEACACMEDCDVQSSSPEAVREYALDQLRLGDIVAISDHDASHGPRWQQGAITVAVVVHGASRQSGHGPGVNALFSSPKGTIEPIITRRANIAEILALA